ncbi:MAG: histone deacetylase [Planctomycetales bacterium]|nr:histone deacetylase [Planctomycetales bacterium]NIM09547.1 histone deacetylase [Planctomycetales bacterium]NIN09035.1 histone deacetylase [Planctomycetales bacterium]NIN78148.1 histone deacetylase [Planctomycetales bacterium]NIO35333.1 histone deacetylase [Planctomycetales bacterium]
MTWLYQDPLFLQHDTGAHPECAPRLQAVTAHLAQTGLDLRCQRPQWEPIGEERMARVHRLDYVETIRRLARGGGGNLDADTVVSARSYDVACQAAGAVCDAVQNVLSGQDRTALCLVRPPGHHARNRSAMGFCLLNNVALGARLATSELDVERVLIVDWDVHHGNGTQEAFWEDEQVGFFSIHRWPFYPGTGHSDETGGGGGLGTTRNVPLPFGTSRDEYRDRFAGELEVFSDRIRPQLVMISAGFDSHCRDPIGSLGLEVEDFAQLTDTVRQVADQHAGGRLVSVLEGGYNPPVLAECVALHLQRLLDCSGGERVRE